MTNDSTHTPGPWRIGRHATTSVVAHGDRGICSTGGYETNMVDPMRLLAENEANARLIAAAPEMLEALVGLARAYKSLPGSRTEAGTWYSTALAAIAKARGEVER